MAQSPSLGQRPRLLLQGRAASLRLSPLEGLVLLTALMVAMYAGYTMYGRATDLNAKPAAAPTYLPAFRSTLSSSVSATGSVQATQQVTLTFGSTGKIREFLVKLGDQVTAGQALARIDDADLRQALSSAEAQLASAQARYAAAVQGPGATDTASALQTIASANAQVGTAQQNLDDLLAGPKATDIATAQQAVITAQTALQTANDAVPKAQNDVIKAQNDVTNAQTAITNAENNVSAARQGVTTAESAVTAARNEVNLAESAVSTRRAEIQIARGYLSAKVTSCGSSYSVPSVPSGGAPAQTALPLSVGFACAGEPVGGSPPPATPLKDALSAEITKYNAVVNAYNAAVSTVTARQTAVTTAERGVTTAEAAVTTAQNAVSTAQNTLATAQTALATALNTLNNGSLLRGMQNAQIGLASAQQKYQDVVAGPKQADLDSSRRGLASAQAALASAQTRMAALFEPAKPDVTLPLQASVAQAQAEVESARKDLSDATITAPFDGQIASITGEVGTQVSATTTVFVLLNPRLIRIDANADQADVSNLRVGQTANVTFDALQGRSYPATITAVGLTPTIQQGVVTYIVTLGVDTSRLAEGTPVPAPGMTAAISVTTNRVENALVVPSRAVRRSGRTSNVTIKTPSGSEQRAVTTGVTNGTLIQIVSGLQEGDEVLVSAPAATSATTTTGGQQTFQGFPGGGAGGGFQQITR